MNLANPLSEVFTHLTISLKYLTNTYITTPTAITAAIIHVKGKPQRAAFATHCATLYTPSAFEFKAKAAVKELVPTAINPCAKLNAKLAILAVIITVL